MTYQVMHDFKVLVSWSQAVVIYILGWTGKGRSSVSEGINFFCVFICLAHHHLKAETFSPCAFRILTEVCTRVFSIHGTLLLSPKPPLIALFLFCDVALNCFWILMTLLFGVIWVLYDFISLLLAVIAYKKIAAELGHKIVFPHFQCNFPSSVCPWGMW